MITLDACLRQVAALHPRLCPRQVLGVRMGLHAAELLELDLPQSGSNTRLLCIVETDGCFADGVSIATGCWLGRRTLRAADVGKVAATFVDTATERGRAVRIWPHPEARARAVARLPHLSSPWYAYLKAYQVMPAPRNRQCSHAALRWRRALSAHVLRRQLDRTAGTGPGDADARPGTCSGERRVGYDSRCSRRSS